MEGIRRVLICGLIPNLGVYVFFGEKKQIKLFLFIKSVFYQRLGGGGSLTPPTDVTGNWGGLGPTFLASAQRF